MDAIRHFRAKTISAGLLLVAAAVLLGFALTMKDARAAVPTGAAPVTGSQVRAPGGSGTLPPGQVPLSRTVVSKPFVAGAARPGSVLYDQYDSPSQYAEGSQNFEVQLSAFTDQSADDFTITSGQVWSIDQVEVAGVYRGNGPADSMNVYIYADSSGFPGAAVITETNLLYQPGPTSGDFVIPLSSPVTLSSGTYWLVRTGQPELLPQRAMALAKADY